MEEQSYTPNCIYIRNRDLNQKLLNEEECVVEVTNDVKENLTTIDKTVVELVISENCFKEVKDELVIENYPNLEKIVIKKNALHYLKSLKICKDKLLKSIEVEESACYNLNTLVIESNNYSLLI